MPNIERRKAAKDWARLAVNLGLLLTDTKRRNAIGNRAKDRVDSLGDVIARKYEETLDRMEAASDALHGRSHWPSRAIAMLAGIGIGTGVGILLAPVSGSAARQSIRDKAVSMKNKLARSAPSAAGEFRQSVASMPPTGTEG
jgi:hypothetical protein